MEHAFSKVEMPFSYEKRIIKESYVKSKGSFLCVDSQLLKPQKPAFEFELLSYLGFFFLSPELYVFIVKNFLLFLQPIATIFINTQGT